MTMISVSRKELIESCEAFSKGSLEQTIDNFIEDSYYIVSKKWYGKERFVRDDQYKQKKYFTHRVNTRQRNNIDKVWKRAQALKNADWIPITQEEFEYFVNWWVPDTKFKLAEEKLVP